MSGSPTLVRVKWVSHNSFQCCNSLVIKIQKPNNQKLHLTVFFWLWNSTMKKQWIFLGWFRRQVSVSSKIWVLSSHVFHICVFDKVFCYLTDSLEFFTVANWCKPMGQSVWHPCVKTLHASIFRSVWTQQGVEFCWWIAWLFTFMHLADAFIQSNLHCIQVTVLHFISSCFPWESNPWSWRC